jgi:hypothetical protein
MKKMIKLTDLSGYAVLAMVKHIVCIQTAGSYTNLYFEGKRGTLTVKETVEQIEQMIYG